MKNSKRKGLWIPIEILLDKKLDNTDKLLLSEIYSYLDNGKECYASNGNFGELLGLTKGAASKRVSKLSRLNYIYTVNKYNNGKCEGRYIYKGKRNSQSIVPVEPEGSSKEITTSIKEELGGTSPEDIEVVPVELGNSSLGKPTNTTTSTVIEKELLEENINNKLEVEPSNKMKSMHEYYIEQYEDAVFNLGQLSGLDERVFNYIYSNELESLKNQIGIETYTMLEPEMQKFFKYQKLLKY